MNFNVLNQCENQFSWQLKKCLFVTLGFYPLNVCMIRLAIISLFLHVEFTLQERDRIIKLWPMTKEKYTMYSNILFCQTQISVIVRNRAPFNQTRNIIVIVYVMGISLSSQAKGFSFRWQAKAFPKRSHKYLGIIRRWHFLCI